MICICICFVFRTCLRHKANAHRRHVVIQVKTLLNAKLGNKFEDLSQILFFLLLLVSLLVCWEARKEKLNHIATIFRNKSNHKFNQDMMGILPSELNRCISISCNKAVRPKGILLYIETRHKRYKSVELSSKCTYIW